MFALGPSLGFEYIPSELRAASNPPVLLGTTVNEQETVDRLALLAQSRLTTLLRLRNVRDVFDPTPGMLSSTFIEDGQDWAKTRVMRSVERHHGKKLLVTRRVAARGDDKSVVGHLAVAPRVYLPGWNPNTIVRASRHRMAPHILVTACHKCKCR